MDVGGAAATADECVGASQELADAERFGDVVVGALTPKEFQLLEYFAQRFGP